MITDLTPRANGIDISKYDQYFRPDLATKQLDFVIQRLSYGMRHDELRLQLKPGVMSMKRRGAYHYYSTSVPWLDQAKFFLDTAGLDYKWLCWDYEISYNNLNARTANDCMKALAWLKEYFPGKVVLYTSPYIYNTYLTPFVGNQPKAWPLWIAQYWYFWSPNKNPGLPTGVTDWALWQYTDKGNGTEFGLARSTAADLDVFNGTPLEMDDWIGIVPRPPQPPIPKTIEERVEDLEAAVFGEVK